MLLVWEAVSKLMPDLYIGEHLFSLWVDER
jgi:hypothetical protein